MEKSFGERVAEAKAVVSSLPPREADALRHGCEPVVFIDPRPIDAAKASTGIIPGAHSVSLSDLEAGVLPAALGDRWARVVTTCQAGPMAAVAAHALMKQGFSRVAYIDGGTQGWLDAGLPTVR